MTRMLRPSWHRFIMLQIGAAVRRWEAQNEQPPIYQDHEAGMRVRLNSRRSRRGSSGPGLASRGYFVRPAQSQLTGCPGRELETCGCALFRTVKWRFTTAPDGSNATFSPEAKVQMRQAFDLWNAENNPANYPNSNCSGIRFEED